MASCRRNLMGSLAFRSHSSALYTNSNKTGLNFRAIALVHTLKFTERSNYNRFHAKSSLVCCCSSSAKYEVQEGPSCIFVGPLETATKDMLEALYHQARDSYYSGRPLILDDMFDKVELKLRWYGSKSVVKYPRCSLKRQSTYADAEVDHSQIWALAGIWASLLVIGIVALVVPPVSTVSVICQDAVHMQLTPHSSMLSSKSVSAANGILAIVLGSSIGYPITMAAVRELQRLWRNDLVALKGSCPGCGEEVFAFVSADESVRPRHKTECHVCERPLVFHAKVENSMSNPGSRWVHGRVYLVARLKDLSPQGSQ